jgi:predicted HTH domain antitoxin
MDLIVRIPDDIASRLSAAGGDLSRRALEALALEEYKTGHISKAELRRILGFETRQKLDGFLNSHGIPPTYSIEDLEKEREDLSRIGM